MVHYVYTNYSNGWVIEAVEGNTTPCQSWMLLPAENLWNEGVRGFLYILAMLYIFLGTAIVSDVFMCAIEVITSKKKKLVRWDEELQDTTEKEVLVWNETVANLTLMALGSSAPEIMLAVIEACQNLGRPALEDDLGTFTIIGSAAFNLLIITAICIVSVPTPEIKRVKELGVFALTSAWSIFAYIWMLVVLHFHSPGEISPGEAWITLAFAPLLVLSAYCQDNGWWIHKCRKTSVEAMQSQTNVRVVSDKTRRHSMIVGMARELQALEKEKQKSSQINLKSIDGDKADIAKAGETGSLGSQTLLVGISPEPADLQPGVASHHQQQQHPVSKNPARARFRFRHAAVRSMLGGKRRPIATMTTNPQSPSGVMASDIVASLNRHKGGAKQISEEDLLGKFTFSSTSYSVLESAGVIDIEVIFHRNVPSSKQKVANGYVKVGNGKAATNGMPPVEKEKETSFANPAMEGGAHTGVVTVEYETREGSARIDKDFKFGQGKLVFAETETRRTITVAIINDDQYEADVDFYVLLRNPTGEAAVGDPSVARVTIIDDDEPGEFEFAAPQYYGDLKVGVIQADVIRQKGCDGSVTLEYSTIDGTARGGDVIGPGSDYKRSDGVLHFQHNETSKTISIECNKDCQGSKNFIITLKNPSLGAKIGGHSATVANISTVCDTDELSDRLAGILDEEDENITWREQFQNAMTLEGGTDENGQAVPLKWYDYLLHFLSFLWKVIFACIPPKHYLGAWPAFFVSLAFIGGLTAIIKQLGDLVGCVLGIEASVTGITIIALGTSLPDTFASRTAALHDEGADAAIGNVTGSNSVNVFVGLGLPWVISSMYALGKGVKYEVSTNNLVQSVVVFTIAGTICIFFLLFRRKVVGGELGGKNPAIKYLSSLFLFSLWCVYVIIASLQAYMPDIFPW